MRQYLLLLLLFGVTTKLLAQVSTIPCEPCNRNINESYIDNASFGNAFYCLDHDLTINGTVSFTGSEIRIGDNVTITLTPNALLVIEGSHLYGCENMWNGIVVQPGGRVIIRGPDEHSAFIEDAKTALNFDMAYSSDTYTDLLLDISDAIFNRNHVSVSIANYHVLHSSVVYPFSVMNTVFTCRHIPFTSGSLAWDNLSTLKQSSATAITSYPATAPVLNDPFIEESNYPSDDGYAFLKPPYSSAYPEKPAAGIKLENLGKFNDLFYGVLIGSAVSSRGEPNTTIFDNLNIGIDAVATNLTVYNSTFQKRYYPLSVGILQVGIKAYADPGDMDLHSLVITTPSPGIIPNNAIFNPDYGIISENYTHNLIDYCDIRSGQDYLSRTYDGLQDPLYGINIFTFHCSSLEVSYNNIYNVLKPIYYFSTDYAGSSTPPSGAGSSGPVTIAHNVIGSIPVGVDRSLLPAKAKIIVAIKFDSDIPASSIHSGTLNCTNNFIADAYFGIWSSYWQGKDVNIAGNTIQLLQNNYYYLGTPYIGETAGIYIEGGIAATTLGNKVTNNTVTGDNSGTIGCLETAIYAELTANADYGCNTVSNSLYGIRFGGDNTPAKCWNNTMDHYNTYGLVLDYVGVIGQQGTAGTLADCTSDNNWLYPNSTWLGLGHYKTLCTNYSNALSSPLVIQNTTNLNPDGAGTYILGSPFPYANSNGSLIYTTPSGACNSCHVDDPAGDRLAAPKGGQNGVFGTTTSTRPAVDTGVLEAIALGTLPIAAADSAARLEVMRQQLYTTLQYDSSLLQHSQVLRGFVQNNTTGSYATIALAAKAIATGDTATAALQAAKLGYNRLTTNYKLYYQWLLANKNPLPVARGRQLPQSLATLYTLANLCPFTDGTVVYGARNLYNYLTNQHLTFSNACGGNTSNKQLNRTDNVKSILSENDIASRDVVKVWPNPSPGTINISLPVESGYNKVEVTDMLGKTIAVRETGKSASNLQLKLNTRAGMYLLKAINTLTGKQEVSKIIVQP